jgi:hypothetical protein
VTEATRPNVIARHGRWVALAAAVALTAKGEYDLALMVNYDPSVAFLFPVALDVYAASAFARHKRGDVLAGVLLMIGAQAAVHLVPLGITDGEQMPWGLVLAVSCVPPIVAWRAHSLGEGSRSSKPVADRPAPDVVSRVEVPAVAPQPVSPVPSTAVARTDVAPVAPPVSHDATTAPGDVAPVSYDRAPDVAPNVEVSHDDTTGAGRDATPATVDAHPRHDTFGADVAPRNGRRPSRQERVSEAVRLVQLEGMAARAAAQQLGLGDAAGIKAVQRAVKRVNGHEPELTNT